MEQFIQNFMDQVNQLPLWLIFIFFFVSAVLQITFPPYPGDTVLIFGGYIASTWLYGGTIYILFPYVLGTLLSSYALYELGARKGEQLLGIKIVAKYFPPASQKKAQGWVTRFGTATLVICKFIPGLNSLIIIFTGIFGFSRIWAYLGTAFAILVHNIVFFLIGRTIGDKWDKIVNFLSAYNKIVIGGVILGIAAYFIVKILTAYRKKNAVNTDKIQKRAMRDEP